MQQNKLYLRILVLAGLALLWMTGIFGRLAYLQLACHRKYMVIAAHQQRRTLEITPKRGAIYDRNMQPLAMSVGVQSAFAIPSEIKDIPMAARLLSDVLGMPADLMRAKLETGATFVWVQRKLSPEKLQAIAALNLKGIYFQEENQRFYPKGDMASHVLGFVDVDEKGLGGVEHEYDSLIRGKGEKIIVMADARQRWFDGSEAQADRGVNVILTIDEKIQYIAERELAAAIEKTRAPAGTVIVQDPNTGAILALANWPKFNPNAATDSLAESRNDRAIASVYEPGSIFKVVTLAAAFDQNLIRSDEVFDCENGQMRVGGHLIHDHKKYGLLTVADILANSSDVGAFKIALRMGSPRFYDYIHAFGFGSLTAVDLPGESRGVLHPLKNWGSFSIASVSMGQEVAVTPVQMVTAISAVANGGILYKPHVVLEMRRNGIRVPLPEQSAQGDPHQIIRPEIAATMRGLMEGVIIHGTGKNARLDGWTVAGKTGTAQKIDPNTKRYSPTNVIASFAGFAPINNPVITILVSIDSPAGYPHDGATVSAPVFKRVAEQVLAYLDVPRDIPLSPRLIEAAYHPEQDTDNASLDDSTPVDFSAQMGAKEDESSQLQRATATKQQLSEVMVAPDEVEGIAVPDFVGKTMREVTESCFRLGLDPVLVGSSLATRQMPESGSKVRRGSKIIVEFGDLSLKAASSGKKGIYQSQ
jgi:cell division protein FtsI (penicillin-binding protein 3)